MESNYRQFKEDVLKNYEFFVRMIDDIRQEGETRFDGSLEALKVQAENIREDRFMLMVVGEAKSGKSTFINAYLKKDILPMDVKQCTNAIVEIKDGEKYRLIATYADDRKRTIEDEDAIKKFMAKNAAMDDAYRDIPVALINNELLMKWQGKPKSEDADVSALLEHVAEDNIYRLTPDEYQKKIRKYIRERKNRWKDLVKKIEIEYPFEDQELKGIEILDTPGVGAEGKVGDLTNQFIAKANAVMFLKPLVGSAMESHSFRNFLDSNSNGRNKNAMFLVLTRAADEIGKNMDKLLQEAHKQYSIIDDHQIITVDSKAEIFANTFAHCTKDEIKQRLKELGQREERDKFLGDTWFDSDGDKDAFLDGLRKLSNFNEMRDRLNLFAHTSEYLALSEFLERMINVSEQASAIIREKIGLWKEKLQDPVQLAAKIEDKKKEIVHLKRTISDGVGEIFERYSKSKDGYIEKKADEVMNDFKKEINSINHSSNGSVDELKKITLRLVQNFTNLSEELQKKIVGECDEKLMACSKDLSIDYRILKPDITPESIDKIINDSRKDKDSYESQDQTTTSAFPLLAAPALLFMGPWAAAGAVVGGLLLYAAGAFDSTEHVSVFSQDRNFDVVSSKLKLDIEKARDSAVNELQDFLVSVLDAYTSILRTNLDKQKDEYDKILQDQRDNDELQEMIRVGKERNGKLTQFVSDMRAVKCGIYKNVTRN